MDNHKNAFACSGYRRAAQNIKVPPTASRRAYGLLPNEKQSPSNKKTLQILSNSAQPITEKRRRPRPKGGNNIAFNNGCCN
ncbi:replication protein [Salmonella enterica]|nr:replication protein [Salmonella enterica]